MPRKNFQNVKCPLCEKNSYKILFPSNLSRADIQKKTMIQDFTATTNEYFKHGRIVKCDHCGLVFVNPREDPSKILSAYEEVIDEDYEETFEDRAVSSSKLLDGVEKYSQKDNLLDIGCGTGIFLSLAAKRGWKTFGIEPSKWAAKLAEKRGIKILGETLEKSTVSKYKFSAVTLWDVIEHLPNPRETLEKINKILEPNGIVAMVTPNIESFTAKILGSRYPWLIRMHLVLFSPKTLKMTLEKTDFEVIAWNHYGRYFNLYYLVNRLKLKNPTIQKLTKILLRNRIVSKFKIYVNFFDFFYVVARKKG